MRDVEVKRAPRTARGERPSALRGRHRRVRIGAMDSRYAVVGDRFDALVDELDLPGAALAVHESGSVVLERRSGELADERSLTAVASVSKAAVALSLLTLVDRGEIDLDSPVARYWPGFDRHGKAALLVRHLLTHQAGLPGIANPALPGDVWLHWEEMIGWLERERPWWEPGSAHGYHPYTFGHLIGEVIRRVTGTMPGEFFRTEIARPLAIDFVIGVNDEDADRVVDQVRLPVTEGPDRKGDSIGWRLNNPSDPGVAYTNSPQWRRAEMPAFNGHATAAGVARLGAILAEGGQLDGHRILSQTLCATAGSQHTNGRDRVTGTTAQFGLGFSIYDDGCFGNLGGIGARLFIDPKRRLAIGYVQNAALPFGDIERPSRELITLTRATAPTPSD